MAQENTGDRIMDAVEGFISKHRRLTVTGELTVLLPCVLLDGWANGPLYFFMDGLVGLAMVVGTLSLGENHDLHHPKSN